MTDHDDTNDINDPIDAALGDAGKRLRREAPDAIASRQALERMNERAVAPTPARKSWWPALIGAGLAAAAVIGVIAIRADDNGTPTVTPVTEPTSTSTPIPATSIEPTTTPVPTTTGPGASGASVLVDAGCITVTTAAGSATGCPLGDEDLDHLEQRVFVADLDGPVLVTSGSADPLTDLTATVDTGNFVSNCRWDDLAPRIPDGGIIELVVCNDTGVMGLTMPAGPFGDTEASYFTLPTPYLPDGADLGLGTPIDGLPRALAFTAPVQDITTCSILLLPDRTGWKEACGFIHGLELDSALALIDPRAQGEIALPSTPYEIAVDDQGLITSARALEAMAPSSGCSINSATQLLQAVDTSSIVMGLGCIGDKAASRPGRCSPRPVRPMDRSRLRYVRTAPGPSRTPARASRHRCRCRSCRSTSGRPGPSQPSRASSSTGGTRSSPSPRSRPSMHSPTNCWPRSERSPPTPSSR